MVICIGVSKKIPCPMYQKCSTKNRTRFTDINKLSHALGDSVCDALIGMRSFMGSDTQSALSLGVESQPCSDN